MINNKELAEYIYKEISNLSWRSRGELFNELTPEVIEFWINHRKVKEGHSEWSEELKKNIWIEDED
jgi:hypothetical protein